LESIIDNSPFEGRYVSLRLRRKEVDFDEERIERRGWMKIEWRDHRREIRVKEHSLAR
jgi:hypothetical protein